MKVVSGPHITTTTTNITTHGYLTTVFGYKLDDGADEVINW